MMTSSNGSIFRVTGPLCGEFTGSRWIPRTKASDAELFDVFFNLCLNKRLSKQLPGWWFETPLWSLWRQCNGCSHKAPRCYFHNVVCLELWKVQYTNIVLFGITNIFGKYSWVVVDVLPSYHMHQPWQKGHTNSNIMMAILFSFRRTHPLWIISLQSENCQPCPH